MLLVPALPSTVLPSNRFITFSPLNLLTPRFSRGDAANRLVIHLRRRRLQPQVRLRPFSILAAYVDSTTLLQDVWDEAGPQAQNRRVYRAAWPECRRT